MAHTQIDFWKNSSDKGKGDKKKLEIVDFKNLSGKEKLKPPNRFISKRPGEIM